MRNITDFMLVPKSFFGKYKYDKDLATPYANESDEVIGGLVSGYMRGQDDVRDAAIHPKMLGMASIELVMSKLTPEEQEFSRTLAAGLIDSLNKQMGFPSCTDCGHSLPHMDEVCYCEYPGCDCDRTSVDDWAKTLDVNSERV